MFVQNRSKDTTEQSTSLIDVFIVKDPIKAFIGNMLTDIIEKVSSIEVLVVSLFNGIKVEISLHD